MTLQYASYPYNSQDRKLDFLKIRGYTYSYAKSELTGKKDARVIVACASGGRSLLAAQTLRAMGYSDVVSMAGGFNEWSKQGFPVEE